MNNEKIKLIAFLVLLSIALVLGVILVQQNQEIRKGAYFAQTNVLLLPTEMTVGVGDEMKVQVWVDTSDDAKVDGLQTDLCYNADYITPKTDSLGDVTEAVVPNSESGLNQVPLAIVVGETDKCIRFAINTNKNATYLKSGLVNVGTVVFKAVAVGSGDLTMKLDKTTVTGDNPSGGMDTYMQVSDVTGASYTVSSSGTGGGSNEPTNPPASADDMWINYKVAFAGVRANRACSTNWQTKLTVLSGDTRREYNNVPLTQTTATNSAGEVIYEGSLQLAGFRQESGVAVFFKGPKHLQVKYGVNNQSASYNKAGGEITLTSSQSGSQVVNLSGYPMLAGDIDGNGVIDGVDFGKVKVKSARFDQVADGGYMAEDLDGSCQVNNNDTILLVRSLNEKQDQVY